jgi:TPR repeat protein
MNRVWIVFAVAVLTTGLLAACVEQTAVRESAGGVPVGANADDLLVVDCLLPPQVRRLGTQMTYLAARRPVQTTAQDCAIRGGEYVAYDRAHYSQALRIWMPLAEEGDPDAQNKVGEIYERGLGTAPDYAQAAVWYRRAAEQGYERAQINLGFLLERGLGVQRDPKAALEWYRRASKLPDAVLIDQADLDAQRNQIASLRSELDASRTDLERARGELRQRERQLQRERDALQKRIDSQPAATAGEAERQRLEEARRTLERQGVELTQRQQRIAELEYASRQQQDRLLLLEAEGASLREQLGLVRTQLQRTQKDLDEYQSLAAENERQVARARADLAALATEGDAAAMARIRQLEEQVAGRERAAREQEQEVARLRREADVLARRVEQAARASESDRAAATRALEQARQALDAAQVAAAERTAAAQQLERELVAERAGQELAVVRVTELESQLREREQALKQQQEMVERLRKESDQWRQKLAQLEQLQAAAGPAVATRAVAADVPIAPPAIQLIEPPLMAMRGAGDMRVPVPRDTNRRSLIGQVTAPGGLYALTVNGVRTNTDARGLFEADVAVTGTETPVSVVAVDRDGRRGTLAFSLVTDEGAQPAAARRQNPLAGVEIGSYYALVIGNQRYEHLPQLHTSGRDAEAVAAMLRDKFGYRVTLLRDANRYQILSELNRLRERLTDRDNLLIYYAGHGELDRINLRGHWLPVDAEMDSTANWISTVSITDILNAMSVRQVLLVVDSCYSGTLTRSALGNLEAGQSDEARDHWLKTLARTRSRTALTSGGLAPVLDGGGGEHSVFAKAFLGVLREINDITEGQRVYREVSARVAFDANRYQVEQLPEYAPIKFSGHEAGDYLFVPKVYLN